MVRLALILSLMMASLNIFGMKKMNPHAKEFVGIHKIIGTTPEQLTRINGTLIELSKGTLEEKNAVEDYCCRVADASYRIVEKTLLILLKNELVNSDGEPFERPCWIMNIDKLVEKEMGKKTE